MPVPAVARLSAVIPLFNTTNKRGHQHADCDAQPKAHTENAAHGHQQESHAATAYHVEVSILHTSKLGMADTTTSDFLKSQNRKSLKAVTNKDLQNQHFFHLCRKMLTINDIANRYRLHLSRFPKINTRRDYEKRLSMLLAWCSMERIGSFSSLISYHLCSGVVKRDRVTGQCRIFLALRVTSIVWIG